MNVELATFETHTAFVALVAASGCAFRALLPVGPVSSSTSNARAAVAALRLAAALADVTHGIAECAALGADRNGLLLLWFIHFLGSYKVPPMVRAFRYRKDAKVTSSSRMFGAENSTIDGNRNQ